MPIPENNTIIAPELTPEEIQQNTANNIIRVLDDTANPTNKFANGDNDAINQVVDSDNKLLGLSTDEQRVMVFIRLHNPNDKFFLNWANIYSLGELYFANYNSDEYRAYQNKLKLLTAKYYNPKKYVLQFGHTTINAFTKDPKSSIPDIPQTTPIDTLDKPTFMDAQYEVKNGYSKISQMRTHLDNNYKYLIGLPYVEPVDKKKFVKLRNNFIRQINAYYTFVYYYNRVNNNNMNERNITLPHLTMSYSEKTNQMLPRIDKVNIRLSDETITQKNNNDAAKLELFLAIKQKMHEQQHQNHNNKKDRTHNDELQKLLKEYLQFDKLYQSKLISDITNRKKKKIINDLVIFQGQLMPGDGSVTNPNEGLNDLVPSTTNLSPLGSAFGNPQKNQKGGYAADLDNMDESDRKRKFFFINRAKRANGQLSS